MSAPVEDTYLALQVRFTTWATRRLLDAVGGLTDEQFARDLGSSHGSIRGTLCHMFGADMWLHSMLTGDWPPYPDWLDPGGAGTPFETIKRAYSDMLTNFEAAAGRLEDPPQGRSFGEKPLTAHGQEVAMWQGVTNMVSHATYHRGQIAALLRQLGLKPPDTDLIHYYFEADGKVWPYS